MSGQIKGANLQKQPAPRTAAEWQRALGNAGYYTDDWLAGIVARWYASGRAMILEGAPGCGKTALARAIARVTNAPLYRVPCSDKVEIASILYEFNSRLQDLEVEKLYREGTIPEHLNEVIFNDKCLVQGKLARSLTDANPDKVVLIDEIDKVTDAKLETAILEYLDEFQITLAETNRVLCPASPEQRPKIIITSNAGMDNERKSGGKTTLSYPILRRGKYVWLPGLTIERQFTILGKAVPELAPLIRLQAILFVYKMNKLQEMEKPIEISETVMFAQSLLFEGVKELNYEFLSPITEDLAKSRKDTERLKDNIKQTLTWLNAKQFGGLTKSQFSESDISLFVKENTIVQ